MQLLVSRGLAATFVVIGAVAVVAPRMSARQYGLPTTDPVALACVRGMGARDVALGAAIFSAAREPRVLRRLLRWASFVGVADALFVAAIRGPRPQHVLHFGGFVVLLIAAAAVDVPPDGK